MKDDLLGLIEEQIAVEFDGKINVLQNSNRQLLGVVYIREGLLIRAEYKTQSAMKALFSIYIDCFDT